MADLANEEVAHEVHHFDRLPDEVIVSMFNRIYDDLKFLCHCTLVSKRFASIVYQIHSVYVRLPSIDIDSKEANWNVDHVFHMMDPRDGEVIHRLTQPPSIERKLKIIMFLQDFQQLESVHLEFACLRTSCSSPFLKWKAKLGSCEPIVESLVSLLPASVHTESEFESDEDQECHSDMFFFENSPDSDCLSFPLTCCSEWLVLVFSLIKHHHSLQSVTCTDPHRHGTLTLKDKQIVEWRKRLLLCEESPSVPIPRTVDMGWFYELHLPVAGYWIKDIFFVFMNFVDGPGAENDQELENSVTWEYDGQENMLGEAVKEIVTEHIGDIMYELHPWY